MVAAACLSCCWFRRREGNIASFGSFDDEQLNLMNYVSALQALDAESEAGGLCTSANEFRSFPAKSADFQSRDRGSVLATIGVCLKTSPPLLLSQAGGGSTTLVPYLPRVDAQANRRVTR